MKKHLIAFVFGLLLTATTAFGATALIQGMTENGVLQGDLVKYLGNVRDLVNELQTNHGTFRTVTTDNKTMVNQLRQVMLYNVMGNPGYAIDTNFDVKNATAVFYSNGGTLKTLAANTNCDTGTAKTITTARWGAAMLTINSSGTCVVTYAASDFASEALAIAGLTAPVATDTVIGYVTILAAGSTWTAGTSALQGGTGGTPATTTNYYNSINGNTLMIGAAVSSSAPAALTNSTALTLNAN